MGETQIEVEAHTSGGFSKKLAHIDLDEAPMKMNYCDDTDAVDINYREKTIEIDVTQLPPELKTIRIKFR